MTDVYVSSPAPAVRKSTPVVRVKLDTGVADETAAYVPVVVPAVCDKVCEAAALVLNVVAAAPYVASAVMLEKSLSKESIVSPALATPPLAVN